MYVCIIHTTSGVHLQRDKETSEHPTISIRAERKPVFEFSWWNREARDPRNSAYKRINIIFRMNILAASVQNEEENLQTDKFNKEMFNN